MYRVLKRRITWILLFLVLIISLVFFATRDELTPQVIYTALKMARLPVYVDKIIGKDLTDSQGFVCREPEELEELLEAIKNGTIVGIAPRLPEGPSEIFQFNLPIEDQKRIYAMHFNYYRGKNLLAFPYFFEKKRGFPRVRIVFTDDPKRILYKFTHIILLKPAPEFAEILSRIEREENEFKIGGVALHFKKSVVVPVFPVGRQGPNYLPKLRRIFILVGLLLLLGILYALNRKRKGDEDATV